MTLIMLVTFFAGRVLAADVEVDKTGWTKVGENEVQIGKLPIESAEFTADGNFSRRLMRLYTNEEYNCTKVAPFSHFSRADTGLETPPTPIKGILPLIKELTLTKV